MKKKLIIFLMISSFFIVNYSQCKSEAVGRFLRRSKIRKIEQIVQHNKFNEFDATMQMRSLHDITRRYPRKIKYRQIILPGQKIQDEFGFPAQQDFKNQKEFIKY